MKLYEEHNGTRAMLLEHKDFDNIDSCVRASRGNHVHTVFIPVEYKDTYKDTELIIKIAPCFMIHGEWLSQIYFYESSVF